MKPEDILQYCLANLEGTVRTESWGESGIFYNPGGVLKRGVYVLTVKEKDGRRPGRWRRRFWRRTGRFAPWGSQSKARLSGRRRPCW